MQINILKRTAICTVVILVAVTLFCVPLIMKYEVYKPSQIKVATGDTVLVNDRISSVWCEAESVSHHDTLEVYLYESEPQTNLSYVETSYTDRRILLPNKAYEYWGFRLLRGSRVTLYGCSVLPGAAVTLVKGRGSLLSCMRENTNSFIPLEDSSEESSESESGQDTSSISSSQGVFSNETLDSYTCDGALEYAKFDTNLSCSASGSRLSESIFSHEVAKTDVYYVLFTGNPYLTVIDSDIQVHLVLDRTRHDHQTSSMKCLNTTECVVPLSFASKEKVFAEMPNRNGSWDEEVVSISCSPRRGLFFLFYLAFAVTIFICAFL